jgi:hypothetical protein
MSTDCELRFATARTEMLIGTCGERANDFEVPLQAIVHPEQIPLILESMVSCLFVVIVLDTRDQ